MQKQIIEKSIELSMRYGFRGVNLDELARELRISKKTIYKFFANKDQLIEATVSDLVEQSARRIDRAFLNGSSLEEKLSTLLGTLIGGQPLPWWMLEELKVHFPASYQIALRIKEHQRLLEIKLYQIGLMNGVFTKEINADLFLLVVEAWITTLQTTESLVKQQQLNYFDVFRQIENIFFHGILSKRIARD